MEVEFYWWLFFIEGGNLVKVIFYWKKRTIKNMKYGKNVYISFCKDVFFYIWETKFSDGKSFSVWIIFIEGKILFEKWVLYGRRILYKWRISYEIKYMSFTWNVNFIVRKYSGESINFGAKMKFIIWMKFITWIKCVSWIKWLTYLNKFCESLIKCSHRIEGICEIPMAYFCGRRVVWNKIKIIRISKFF